jgi:hypothetical protein
MAVTITSVNYLHRLPNLQQLLLPYNSLTGLTITGCPHLTTLEVYNNDIPSIDLSNCPEIVEFYVSNNTNLSSVSIPTFSACTYFNIGQGAITSQTTIDNIIIGLVNQGLSSGYLFLDGGTNSTPSTDGINAAAYLTYALGWTVTYNT